MLLLLLTGFLMPENRITSSRSLRDLRLLRVPARMYFRLAALVFRCINELPLAYIWGLDLQLVADIKITMVAVFSGYRATIIPFTYRLTIRH